VVIILIILNIQTAGTLWSNMAAVRSHEKTTARRGKNPTLPIRNKKIPARHGFYTFVSAA